MLNGSYENQPKKLNYSNILQLNLSTLHNIPQHPRLQCPELKNGSQVSFSCSLLPTLASFYSEKLAEPLLSFFRPCCMSSSGLVLHKTGPTLWNCCSCADCSTQSADQLQPAFHIQNIILLDLQPKPQQHLASKQGVLILCLQLPTAQCCLHGKLLRIYLGQVIFFLIWTLEQIFLNNLDSPPRIT